MLAIGIILLVVAGVELFMALGLSSSDAGLILLFSAISSLLSGLGFVIHSRCTQRLTTNSNNQRFLWGGTKCDARCISAARGRMWKRKK